MRERWRRVTIIAGVVITAAVFLSVVEVRSREKTMPVAENWFRNEAAIVRDGLEATGANVISTSEIRESTYCRELDFELSSKRRCAEVANELRERGIPGYTFLSSATTSIVLAKTMPSDLLQVLIEHVSVLADPGESGVPHLRALGATAPACLITNRVYAFRP